MTGNLGKEKTKITTKRGAVWRVIFGDVDALPQISRSCRNLVINFI